MLGWLFSPIVVPACPRRRSRCDSGQRVDAQPAPVLRLHFRSPPSPTGHVRSRIMQRREFIGAVTASAATASLPARADEPRAKADPPPERPKETRRGDMIYRQLGSTKEEVSA